MRKTLSPALALVTASAALAQEVPPTTGPGRPVEPLSRPVAPADAELGEPQPSPMPRPDAPRQRHPLAPGWTLRAIPDGPTIALGGGAGRVGSLAAFCLSGAPWLALELDPAPEAASVRAGFGFAGEQVEAEALREDGAGGAYVVELAEGPLAGRLAGADAEATLAINGTQQGVLSLAGSSAAIRTALEECHDF